MNVTLIKDEIKPGDIVELKKYKMLKPQYRGAIGKIIKVEQENRFVAWFDKPKTWGSGTIIFRSDIKKVLFNESL